MSQSSRAPAVAPRALVAALATGALADAAVRLLPHGVDLVVIVAVVLGALAWLARDAARDVPRPAVALGATALAFAALTLLRDAPQLVVLDTLATLAALLALVVVLRHERADAPHAATRSPMSDATDAIHATDATPLATLARAVVTGVRVAAGAPLLATAAADAAPGSRTVAVTGAGTLVRGGLLAAPVLLVFSALLLSADPAFARLWSPFELGFETLAEHVVVILFVAWGTAGTLHAALVAPREDAHHGALAVVRRVARAPLATFRIGTREVVVALALVALLLATFAALQLRWLAGGAAALASAGATPAEYARRGFFELVTLAALALPMLLVAHAIVVVDGARLDATHAAGALAPATAPASPRALRAVRTVAAVLVALLLLLLVSAADRLRLYVQAYGLTEARVYASALMTWLGVVLVLAAVTLRRARASAFVTGALVAGWATLVALHVVNPDATIARVNLARGAEGKPMDARYLGRLSADAAPVLAARLPALMASHPDPATRCALRTALHRAATRADAGGEWRGPRLAIARARAALPAWAREAPPACGGDARR